MLGGVSLEIPPVVAQENGIQTSEPKQLEEKPQQQIEVSVAEKLANWRGYLSSTEQALARNASEIEDLGKASSEIGLIRREALKLGQFLQPLVLQLKVQLDELGPPPKEGEPAESELIAAKRKAIEKQFSALDGDLKAVGLFSIRAAQIEQDIITNRRSRFADELSRHTTTVFDVNLWQAAWRGTAGIGGRFSILLGDSFVVMKTRFDQQPSLAMILAGIIGLIGLLLLFLNKFLLRCDARLMPSDAHGVIDWQVKIWLAGLLFIRKALLPSLALAAIYFAFTSFELLAARLQAFVFEVLVSLIVVAIVWALGSAYLAPTRSNRRFIPMSDKSALRTFNLISYGILSLILFRLLNKTAVILVSPFELTLALSVLSALVCFIFTFLALQSISVGLESGPVQLGTGGTPATKRNIVRWGIISPFLWLATFAGFIALVLGYLAFAEFLSVQIVIGALIFSITWLIIEFLDLHRDRYLDVESGRWRQLSQITGMSRQSVLQGSVFGFGISKLAIIFASAVVFLISWGYRANDWTGSVREAFFGFKIGGLSISFSSIVLAFCLFVVGYLLARAIQHWLQKQFLPTTGLDQGLQNSIATIFGYVGIVFAVLLAVTAAGLDLSKVAIVAGALSVGIGFGLQSIVNNFVSGLILLAERPIKAGDWIITSGAQGTVRKTSVRSTEIETFDGATVIIPNSTLITDTVTNWTHNNRKGRVIVGIGVSYDCDPEQVRDILLACASEHERIVSFPAPVVLLQDFGNDALIFELRAYMANINNSASTKSDLRFAIFKALREAKIEIPFPQRDIHIKSTPENFVLGDMAPAAAPAKKVAQRDPVEE